MSQQAITIVSVTQGNLIREGALVHLNPMMRDEHSLIEVPVYITAAAYKEAVDIQEGAPPAWRAFNVAYAAQSILVRNGKKQCLFRSINRAKMVRLKAVLGPGDDGSPCITVLLPDED